MKRPNLIKRALCHLMCPGFRANIPKDDEPGPWIACAIKTYSCGGRREIHTVYVDSGLIDAYYTARWLAWVLDMNTLPDFGVDWAVRRPTEEDK